jgi:hypothetical protein
MTAVAPQLCHNAMDIHANTPVICADLASDTATDNGAERADLPFRRSLTGAQRAMAGAVPK